MRKRLIDPMIWESAEDKHWSSDYFVVMAAAISNADDEGRGRISAVLKNIKFMIKSERKFKNILKDLSDSIKVYSKIYYFLPNWKKYQKISHPIPSRLPSPSDIPDKDLSPNSTGINPELIQNDSAPIEVKVKEVNRIEVKVKDDNVDNSVDNSESKPDNDDLPLPFYLDKNLLFFTSENYKHTPKNFDDNNELTNSINHLFRDFTTLIPTQSEKTRMLNIINRFRKIGVRKQTAFEIALKSFQELNTFNKEKRNFAYLSTVIERRINDALTRAREERANRLRDEEKAEVSKLNGVINTETESVDLTDVINSVKYS